MDNFKIIAEIGCIHIGSLERAKKLAKMAKICGAHVLKTQKRNPKESTPKKLWNKPHPNQMFSYGDTYLEHRINVELSVGEHKELKQYCEDIDIEYSTSVFDITSAKEIIQLNPKFIKIPSCINHNEDVLKILLNEYGGDIHFSLGMTTEYEREIIYDRLPQWDDRLVVYHCTSGYPVPFEQMYLKEIETLTKIFSRVGLSNHGYGITMEPIAYVLGARYFERHFTDDRLYRHTDSGAAVEPHGLAKIIRDIKATQQALKFKPSELEDIEQKQRDKLRV